MQDYAYAQLRADKGLVNLEGCIQGDAGCRRQYIPVSTDVIEDPETDKQNLLRAHLWARALPTGRGYAALHDGTHATHLGRVCVGPGAEGTYYLTIYADETTSGDGRLSASADGVDSTESNSDDPVDGVDDFGWWRSSDDHGCFCVGGDSGLPPGTAGLCTGAVPYCAGRTMPPASGRVIKGYTMVITHLPFTRGLIPGDGTLMGCVSYGQWRHYEVHTTGVSDAQIDIQLSAPVGGMYAKVGAVPTLDSYDMRAQPPLRQLTLSPCDVTVPNVWYFAVMLGEESEGVEETVFTMVMTASSASASVDTNTLYTGNTCCGGYSYWLVDHVPDNQALSINVTVTSGALHALFLQYGSCPTFVPGDRYQTCNGLCEVGWVTKWDVISGERHSLNQTTLTVPMGERREKTDKRRAGSWYVGVKALPGESGEYSMSLRLASPAVKPKKPYCSGLDRFCASYTQRFATLPLTTAAEARAPGELGLSSYAIESAATSSSAPSARGMRTSFPLAMVVTAAAAIALLAGGSTCSCTRNPARTAARGDVRVFQ